MLETCVNQAAGLQALALESPPRLVALTSHGQQQGELPLLWSLCATWVELGFPVAVLDGQSHESEKNPGLLQWLEAPQSHVHEEYDSWTVIPSAEGFDHLLTQEYPTQVLGSLASHYAVVLIYANAKTVSRLLKGSGLSPLLLVAPLMASVLTAYQALKQLLLDAQLCPTVANIALSSNAIMTTHASVQHLQDCAMTFLGYRLRPVAIRAAATDDRSQDDIYRLAMQLLENAMPLQRHFFVRGQ